MVYLFRGYRQSIGICFLILFEDVLLCFCPCFIGTVRHSPSVKAYSPCRQSRVYESAIVVSAMLATRCGKRASFGDEDCTDVSFDEDCFVEMN